MKTLQFPMILTHRDNPHAQVVVATAEQLAEMPAEYLPADIGTLPAVVTAAAAIPGVNLDVAAAGNVAADTADDAEGRQSLAEAVDEFTAHVQAEEKRLAAIRDEIERDRRELSQQVAALNDREQALANDRTEFEAQRAAITGTIGGTGDTAAYAGDASAAAEGAATGDEAAAPAAPAKRTRAAAKEGA